MSRADEQFDRSKWLVSRLPKFNKIMVVEFNTGGANFIPVRQASARRPDSVSGSGGDADDSSVSFSTQSLQQAAKDISASRPEKVAQASALVADGSYPSDSDMDKLAGFLAQRL